VLAIRWDTVVVGGALIIVIGYLVVQAAFRVNAAYGFDALMLAWRDVTNAADVRDVRAERREERRRDGGSPVAGDAMHRGPCAPRGSRVPRHAPRWSRHDSTTRDSLRSRMP